MKQKLGKFFIDAAKLVLAGVVITSIMQDVIELSIIEKEEEIQ